MHDARWRTILPGGRRYLSELRNYVAAARAGHARQYLGHNPLGRISVAALLLLLLIMAGTGLVLAGTDLFYPPLGRRLASRVAAAGIDPATLAPASRGCTAPCRDTACRASGAVQRP